MRRNYHYFRPESFHFILSACKNCWVKGEWWLQLTDPRNNIWTITFRKDVFFKGTIPNNKFANFLFSSLGIEEFVS